jgi:biotin-(acetyl-CoA carboxylase) ligase
MIGKPLAINTQTGIVRGIATGIAEDGALIVKTNGAETRILSGDVTIMPSTDVH